VNVVLSFEIIKLSNIGLTIEDRQLHASDRCMYCYTPGMAPAGKPTGTIDTFVKVIAPTVALLGAIAALFKVSKFLGSITCVTGLVIFLVLSADRLQARKKQTIAGMCIGAAIFVAGYALYNYLASSR
jgi:hypothetical protein